MILAVVGSTLLAGNAEAQRLIAEAFDRWQPDGFTSGGAKGVDSIAEYYARSIWHLPEDRIFIYEPKVRRWWGEGGFMERNLQIARTCDALVRVVSSQTKTYGSGWTRDRAKEMGKPTESFVVVQMDAETATDGERDPL